jgi:hypothetical protein
MKVVPFEHIPIIKRACEDEGLEYTCIDDFSEFIGRISDGVRSFLG